MSIQTMVVTGGVATGKSTFLKLLLPLLPPDTVCFDCDRETARLLTTEDVRTKLRQIFGDAVVSSAHEVDRVLIRRMILQDAAKRKALEDVLHPEIQNKYDQVRKSELPEGACLVADVPLYFDSGFSAYPDLSIVVACSRETQVTRLMNRANLQRAPAEAWADLQRPVAEKIPLADLVVWNDGVEVVLASQAAIVAQNFLKL